jgi:hypothetical protein
LDNHQTVLERAFEIARSGSCAKVDEIRRQLKREGYSAAQLQQVTGRMLSVQLGALIEQAQADKAESEPAEKDA